MLEFILYALFMSAICSICRWLWKTPDLKCGFCGERTVISTHGVYRRVTCYNCMAEIYQMRKDGEWAASSADEVNAYYKAARQSTQIEKIKVTPSTWRRLISFED
jgi:hypothetical protein